MNKIIELPKASLSTKLSACYQFEARKVDGTVTRKSAVFKNLITDFGLDNLAMLGSRSLYAGKCYVGTGTTAPSFADTSLAVPLANTSSYSQTSAISETVSPWRQTIKVTATFAVGAVVGNITEVGFGDTAGLFSRALVVDGGGSPTAFPIAANEQLIVVYQLTQYPPIIDATGTMSIGANNYNWTSRANGLVGVNPNQWQLTGVGGNEIPYRISAGSFPRGTFGAKDTGGGLAPLPGYAQSGDFVFSTVADAYISGSHKVSGTATCGPTGGAGSLRVVTVNFTSAWCQIEYSPPIVKTNTQTLVLPYSFTWSRG